MDRVAILISVFALAIAAGSFALKSKPIPVPCVQCPNDAKIEKLTADLGNTKDSLKNLYDFNGIARWSQPLPGDVLEKYKEAEVCYICDGETVWKIPIQLQGLWRDATGKQISPTQLTILMDFENKSDRNTAKPKIEWDISVGKTLHVGGSYEIDSNPPISPNLAKRVVAYPASPWKEVNLLASKGENGYSSTGIDDSKNTKKLILLFVPKKK